MKKADAYGAGPSAFFLASSRPGSWQLLHPRLDLAAMASRLKSTQASVI